MKQAKKNKEHKLMWMRNMALARQSFKQLRHHLKQLRQEKDNNVLIVVEGEWGNKLGKVLCDFQLISCPPPTEERKKEIANYILAHRTA